MRAKVAVLLAVLPVLAACSQPAYLSDAPPPADPAPAATGTPGAISSTELNTALFGTPTGPATGLSTGTANLSQTAPVTNSAPTAVAPAAPASAEGNALGISNTQDFKTVTANETIEQNKARIEANKAAYQQIEPTALPVRPDASKTSSVIDYALSATNALGQQVYDRPAPKPDTTAANCLNYTSEEAAQEAFLKAGGPKRDPKRLDPDGDGFACKFDPTPFQKAAG